MIHFFFPIIVFVFSINIFADSTFGYVIPTSANIGDDFQSVAAKQFLPNNCISINREYIHDFHYKTPVHTIVNGWFMSHKNGYWDLTSPPPTKSWPPSEDIIPLFISIHFAKSFFPTILMPENLAYLKKYEPIGTRDITTYNQLRDHGIDAFFSGCLTLTLTNDATTRNDIIYLVDLDPESIRYIRAHTKFPTVILTHGKPILQSLCPEHRLKYAEYVLDLYKRAKCVVTSRLHATMPCLAFNTPVLFVHRTGAEHDDARFPGLLDLAHHCSKEALSNDRCMYDFNNPPKNPDRYLEIRNDLIQKIQKWVRNISN